MAQNEVVEEKIRTFVRQRPALPDDVPQNANPPPPPTFLGGGIDVDDDCLDVTEASICYTANDQQRCYEVDGGFDGDSTQAELYEATARSIVDAVGSGYNGTILAYGQTGSGKTHTMRGGISVAEAGITPRALLQLFEPEQKEGIAQGAQQKRKGNASHRCLFDPGEQESGVGWRCWSLVPKL